MNKAIIYLIHEIGFPYKYNIQIITTGYYTGNGRYCKTWDEVIETCKYWNVELKDIKIF